jgi:CBS domain-containing protein
MSEPPSPSLSPSPSLLANLRVELMRKAPFLLMQPAHVDALLRGSAQVYHAPGETIVSPAHGTIRHLYCIRSGRVTHRLPQAQGADFQFEAGDLFPLGALMSARAVMGSYLAHEDTFCLRIDADIVHDVASRSVPFADFLNRSILTLLEASQRMLRESHAAQALAEQSLESPLGELLRNQPVSVRPDTGVGEALEAMHRRRLGSMPVVDAEGRVLGILTRYDVLGRIALPQLPLSTPIEQVMTRPVRTLAASESALDAALLMSQHGIRHVPVTEAGRLIGIVSERDLFAIQRLSLKDLGTAIRSARDLGTLREAGSDIRAFASTLLSQGVQARQLTRLISRLNDALTGRLLELVALRHQLDLRHACWLAAGSEGREEQTIATDQDNGLLLDDDEAAGDRPRWLAFAGEVNRALEDCGAPLCRGGVMASNPQWCLVADEWRARFRQWIARGEGEDLLDASIWLDFRVLAGRPELAAGLRPAIGALVRQHPRFLRQLAGAALRNRVPLDWLGGIETRVQDGRELLDIKLHGTMIYVDAARLLALAHGVEAVNTRSRFEGIARALRVPPSEAEGWIGGFEYLQMLRLRGQIAQDAAAGGIVHAGRSNVPAPAPGANAAARPNPVPNPNPNPNLLDVATLSDIDRRILKESLRIARRLQQRIELDFLA